MPSVSSRRGGPGPVTGGTATPIDTVAATEFAGNLALGNAPGPWQFSGTTNSARGGLRSGSLPFMHCGIRLTYRKRSFLVRSISLTSID